MANGIVARVVVLIGVLAACGPASERPDLDGGNSLPDDGTDGGSSVGGGVGEIDPVSYESGTRIMARTTKTTVQTADGARMITTSFAGWFDAQRNEGCAPALASDGKTRCIPAAQAVIATLHGDAACTVPVVLVGTTCTEVPPAYIAVPAASPAACTAVVNGPKLHRRGTRYPTLYRKSGTACNAVATTDVVGYAPGAEVLPAEFAEMTVTSAMP